MLSDHRISSKTFVQEINALSANFHPALMKVLIFWGNYVAMVDEVKKKKTEEMVLLFL